MPIAFHNKYPVWRLCQRLLLKQLVARVQLRILIPTQVSAEIKQLSISLFYHLTQFALLSRDNSKDSVQESCRTDIDRPHLYLIHIYENTFQTSVCNKVHPLPLLVHQLYRLMGPREASSCSAARSFWAVQNEMRVAASRTAPGQWAQPPRVLSHTGSGAGAAPGQSWRTAWWQGWGCIMAGTQWGKAVLLRAGCQQGPVLPARVQLRVKP